MYSPKYFQENNMEKIKEFIKHNSFGILFTQHEGRPIASHLPFYMEEKDDDLYLVSHFSKANEQWRTLEDQQVLIVFPGPHSYISSSWYQEEGTVPTWNYLTTHVYGTCELLQDEGKVLEILKKTAHFYEEPLQQAWKVEDHLDAVKKMINGIVAFKVKVEDIEAKAKLSQNHSTERRERVIEALEMTYDRYDGKKIAKEMRDRLK